MLKTRVLTALALLSVFAPALFFLPPLGWAWFVVALVVPAFWEWGGLMRLSAIARSVLALTALAVAAAAITLAPAAFGGEDWSREAAWAFGRWLYLPALAFWIVLLPLWLWRRWPLPGLGGGLATGAVVLLPALLALIQLRQLGSGTLLGILAIVWVADVAAYFAGRRFGKRKLAPSISPGKTWAGAWGALAGVLVYGFVASAGLPDTLRTGSFVLAAVLVALTLLGIVGDLFESLLKRQAGVKDSSDLLPGHGGILDRIDSQTSTLPFVATLWLLFF